MPGLSRCRFYLNSKYIKKASNLKSYQKTPLKLLNNIFPLTFVSVNNVKHRGENGVELDVLLVHVVWKCVFLLYLVSMD